MESGTQSVEWVREEFAQADLADKRLNHRLVKTALHLARSPLSPINEACGDWASTQAAYRLFDNARASPQAILAPHVRETAHAHDRLWRAGAGDARYGLLFLRTASGDPASWADWQEQQGA